MIGTFSFPLTKPDFCLENNTVLKTLTPLSFVLLTPEGPTLPRLCHSMYSIPPLETSRDGQYQSQLSQSELRILLNVEIQFLFSVGEVGSTQLPSEHPSWDRQGSQSWNVVNNTEERQAKVLGIAGGSVLPWSPFHRWTFQILEPCPNPPCGVITVSQLASQS